MKAPETVTGLKVNSSMAIEKLIGYHPQEAGFQEWRTIDHCFKIFGRLSGLTSEELENRTQEILDKLCLMV